MWETVAIIGLLGGLEFTLWLIQRNQDKKSEAEDRKMQSKQLDVLDGILTELAIQNAEDVSLETVRGHKTNP